MEGSCESGIQVTIVWAGFRIGSRYWCSIRDPKATDIPGGTFN
ncbi:hypothetical protein FOZG_07232 [Fusarium oxysporum Fo47]|uniref:Uncharacterized protein n=1 Tax=Fusarium oxysporum Fo47 TaxID=660027 RepID=W9KCZ9_FUSOX|nr:hypothetical protein FOZG_07232 [Fusarium oxysporum Fo47]